MEEITNQILEDIKRQKHLEEQDYMSDMDNFDLNSLFTFGINFDMLKMVINNLIKSNHRVNCKLSELKIDKINSEQKADKLEMAILDLQIANEQSNKIKTELQEKKAKLSTKNYKSDMDMALKEKEYYSSSLNSMDKNESYKIDRILKNITKFNLGPNVKANEEMTKKLEEYNKKLKEENEAYKQELENFKNKINNDISTKLEELSKKLEDAKSRMISNDKEFIAMKETIKNTEEKVDNKLTKEIPELIDNILNDKIATLELKIDENKKDNELDLKRVSGNLREELANLQKNFIEKGNETENKIFKMRTTENNLAEKLKYLSEEKLKEYLTLNAYKQSQTKLEDKMTTDKNHFNTEMDALNSNLTSLKNKLHEFMEDQTDHNNLTQLMKKFEMAQNILYRSQNTMDDYEKEKKRFANLDPKRVVMMETFDEFKSNINKMIQNFNKEFQDMKSDIIDRNNKFIGSQASLKDLKNLEDDLISKMDELYNSINNKFAEKNLILRNNKIMELKVKHLVEEYRKNEKSDTWMLSKMPIGHLCASCEAYLGDIKETANTKYVPWNKYPTKDSADKLYRVGAGYSRMLQMISPDNKNKNKNSTSSNIFEGLSPKGIGKQQDYLEDIKENNKYKNLNNSALNATLNNETNSSKLHNFENKMAQTKFKLPNLLKVKHLKKNSTFSNFNSDDIDDNSKGNKINNNSVLNFSSLGLNQKNMGRLSNRVKNDDSDKDEIIHSPNTAERKNIIEEEKKGPKILKVIKKK